MPGLKAGVWGLALAAGLMLGLFAAHAAPKAPEAEGGGLRPQQLYELYERICAGVREQSGEDAALGCMAWREDREAVADDMSYYAQSLCPHLNQACSSSEDSRRRPLILQFGLAAQCMQAMPACGKKEDKYAEQTPRDFPLPQACRDIGIGYSAIKFVSSPGATGSVVDILIAHEDFSHESYRVRLPDVTPGSPGFYDSLSTALAHGCERVPAGSPSPIGVVAGFIRDFVLLPRTSPGAAELRKHCAKHCRMKGFIGTRE